MSSVKIMSEKGGLVTLADPFRGGKFKTKTRGVTVSVLDGGYLRLKSAPNGFVELTLQLTD